MSRSVNDFLIVEKGGFNAKPDNNEVVKIPKDGHCCYHMYLKKK